MDWWISFSLSLDAPLASHKLSFEFWYNSFWYCTSQSIYGYSFLLCLHIFTNLHLPITISMQVYWKHNVRNCVTYTMQSKTSVRKWNFRKIKLKKCTGARHADCKLVIFWLKFILENIWNIENVLLKKSTSNLFCCRMWQAVNFPFTILTRGQSAEFHEPWI